MSAYRKGAPVAVGIGEAVVFRINQGAGTPLDWAQAVEVVQHPTTGLKRAELVEVIAYLGAQLVGQRNAPSRNAVLAMHQIVAIANEYTDVTS